MRGVRRAQREQSRSSRGQGNGTDIRALAPATLHLIVAIRELASGASVQQVSADPGYESDTAFITMFKKALGKPPAKYLSSVAQNDGSAFVA